MGVVEAVLYADPKKRAHVTEDIDYAWEEMTEEQREVFDALNHDMEDGAYEDLEDDFVNILNEGQQAIVTDSVKDALEAKLNRKQ